MNDQNEAKLIFVFNADSGGLFNAFKDSLHKTSRKSTYECNLCKFTYGFFGMKKEWKDFVNGLDVPVEYMKKDHFKFEFLHRDEFKEKYTVKNAKFPSVYLEQGNNLELFISQDEMNAIKEIYDLKDLVNKKISEYNL